MNNKLIKKLKTKHEYIAVSWYLNNPRGRQLTSLGVKNNNNWNQKTEKKKTTLYIIFGFGL